ncbi:MAG: hypothetical protein Q9195_008498 [Heterodermia aff. obscurata]
MADTSAGRMNFVRQRVRDTRRQLRDVFQYNLETFRRQPMREISGSLGDLGTLLPIMIALASQSSRNVVPAISLSTTLVFSGLANIFTGFAFGIPLPVQPMKAIASVALARDFNMAEVASAGLFVAGVIGFLSITGLLEWFTRRIPIPVIKGIQVGAGFTLVIYAGTLLKVPMPFTGDSVGWIIVALLAFLALLWMPMYPRVPYALAVVLIGAVIAIINITTSHDAGLLRLGLWRPYAFVPSPSSFRVGALEAGLGQRSGASIIFLGLVKLLLGLFAAPFAQEIFNAFPKNLLGVMVIAAGLELVGVGESLNTAGALDLRHKNSNDGILESSNEASGDKGAQPLSEAERKRRWTIMAITIGGLLAFHNDAIGFLADVREKAEYA